MCCHQEKTRSCFTDTDSCQEVLIKEAAGTGAAQRSVNQQRLSVRCSVFYFLVDKRLS